MSRLTDLRLFGWRLLVVARLLELPWAGAALCRLLNRRTVGRLPQFGSER
jgi:hypothetical protein